MKYFLGALIFAFVPFTLSAQQLIPQDVTVEVNPEVPLPNSRVSIEIESFIIDLNRSNISWILDGKVIQQAIGDKDLSFTTGPVGTQHTLTLQIQTLEGQIVSRDILINPGQVDLIWEALDSYTPTLYRGKALNAHESGIEILAIPYFLDQNGKQINPKSLIYTWTVNKKLQQSASGPGRDTFVFLGPSLYRDALVTVDVESVDRVYIGRRSLNLKAQTPKIIFYLNEPLRGVLSSYPITNTLDLVRDEMVVRAVPYFFSSIDDIENLKFNWKIDGRNLITTGDRKEINLRKPESGSGRSNITLEINQVQKILQFARGSFTATFTEKQEEVNTSRDTNFFGL